MLVTKGQPGTLATRERILFQAQVLLPSCVAFLSCLPDRLQISRPLAAREVSSPAVPAHRVQCHDGNQRTEGKRCLKSPANALIASGSIENTTG